MYLIGGDKERFGVLFEVDSPDYNNTPPASSFSVGYGANLNTYHPSNPVSSI